MGGVPNLERSVALVNSAELSAEQEESSDELQHRDHWLHAFTTIRDNLKKCGGRAAVGGSAILT